MRTKALQALLGIALGLGLAQEAPLRAELVGFALLPPDTFAPGPASGAYRQTPGLRGTPEFGGQPVQGFSAVQFGPRPGSFWVLSDNGFGSKANSPDYLLRIYLVTPDPKTPGGGTGTVRVDRFLQLRDPHRRVPFPILMETHPERMETHPERPLTGYDFDIESFAFAADGTLWVGDEFGPFLLRFDANGVLLDPPFPTPDYGPGKDPTRDLVRAPQNPSLWLNPVGPGQPSPANLPTSRGFEGMTANPDRTRLYALLEGTVVGDPPGTLRLMEFDPLAKRWGGLVGLYPLDDPSHAIGEMAVVNEHEYLVIERDNEQGEKARTKRIYKIDLRRKGPDGVLAKELVVDLLNIADPQGLAPSTREGVFRFPYLTIESVLVLDAQTLLVVNDNNYPATGGRGAGIKDATEFIWLKLPKPLNLAPGVGSR